MVKIIDATGLACPRPVVLAKKELEVAHELTIIVDNTTAVENIKRMGATMGASVTVEEKEGVYSLHLTKNKTTAEQTNRAPEKIPVPRGPVEGPFVVVISSETMGRGDDKLGFVLMKGFIHTLLDLDTLPGTMIFYNSGVKLAVQDSDVIDDLKELESRGVELLICGTCANYFEIKDSLGAGVISNMYDIAGTMSKAGRLVCP